MNCLLICLLIYKHLLIYKKSAVSLIYYPKGHRLDHIHACNFQCVHDNHRWHKWQKLFFFKKKTTRAHLVLFIHSSGVKNFLSVAWIWNDCTLRPIWYLKLLMFGMEHNLFGAFIYLKLFVNINFTRNVDALQDSTRKFVIDFLWEYNLTLQGWKNLFHKKFKDW